MTALRHVPDLPALEAVVTAAQTGSMGAAAERLGVSQQAVSARIRTAESLLGVAIFQRSPRGVELTPAGQLVVTWAHEILVAATALETGVAGLRVDGRETTRVAASNTVAECLLAGWAGQLRAQHPEARLRAHPGNSEQVLAAITAGGVDLGFVECPTVPRTVASRTVAHDSLVVVVAPDHPWTRRRRGITRAELAATPLVVREQGSGTRQTLEKAVPELVDPLLELPSTAAVRTVVLTTGAPSVLSSLAVQNDVAAGRLVRVDLVDVAMPRALRAVWNPNQRPRGLAADLLGIALASRS